MELFPREKNKVCPELERSLIVGVLNILVQTYIDRFSDILIILSTKTRQDMGKKLARIGCSRKIYIDKENEKK